MTSPVDPNQICLTGENSFIRLSAEPGGNLTTRASHWRVLWSPSGAGHVLFLKSDDLSDNPVRVYSDNIALTRYLQGEIESMLFPEFANTSLPVIGAEFSKSGDPANFWTETVAATDESVVLSWYDFLTPFMLNVPGRQRGRAPSRCVQLFHTGSRSPTDRGQTGSQRRGIAGKCAGRRKVVRRASPGRKRGSNHSSPAGNRAGGQPKPKPRWDVHLPGAGNRGGSLAGVFRPLIAGPSGSAVSPRLSGWTARPGICRHAPAPAALLPKHRLPVTSSLAQPQTASSALKSGL